MENVGPGEFGPPQNHPNSPPDPDPAPGGALGGLGAAFGGSGGGLRGLQEAQKLLWEALGQPLEGPEKVWGPPGAHIYR